VHALEQARFRVVNPTPTLTGEKKAGKTMEGGKGSPPFRSIFLRFSAFSASGDVFFSRTFFGENFGYCRAACPA